MVKFNNRETKRIFNSSMYSMSVENVLFSRLSHNRFQSFYSNVVVYNVFKQNTAPWQTDCCTLYARKAYCWCHIYDWDGLLSGYFQQIVGGIAIHQMVKHQLKWQYHQIWPQYAECLTMLSIGRNAKIQNDQSKNKKKKKTVTVFNGFFLVNR